MKILALLLAAVLALSSCAQMSQLGDWAKTPGGQEVINAALLDALKIVGTLLLAGAPQGRDLRSEAISRLEERHPGLSQKEAAYWVDRAIAIRHGK